MSAKQKSMWLIAAMVGPMLQMAGTTGILSGTVTATICLLICWGVQKSTEKSLSGSKAICILQILWLTVLLSVILQWTVGIWPTGKAYPFVPLALLILAAASGLNSTENAAQVNTIVFWCAAALIGVLLLAGTEEIELQQLDYGWEAPSARVMLVLLLPTVGSILPSKQNANLGWCYLGIGALFVVMTLWTGGIAPSVGTEGKPWPVYEAARSISLFGRAKRFESLLSVGATLAYFSLLSLIMRSIGCLAGRLSSKAEKPSVVGAAIVSFGILISGLSVPASYAAIMTVLLLVILPLLEQIAGTQKKLKKGEKST